MKAVEKCLHCGSDNITRDFELESYVCNDCDSSAGGANFWQ